MKTRFYGIAEIVFIVLMACIPLFNAFPYRVNIFLSWEGAYRMSEGQLPFRDFGIPLGGMFWVIPALFFKLFGPQMITLIKAQIFINIISGLAFRSILKNLNTNAGVRLVSVVLFCLSYSLFNFWPWYNHTVIVYELLALAFLFRYISGVIGRYRVMWLVLSALFLCFSFFTKQDGGGMAILIGVVLLAFHCLLRKKWTPLVIYIGSFILIMGCFIAVFAPYHAGYWFNHGQPPHTARISLSEISGEFFTGSQWIKFYLFLIVILLMVRYKSWKELWSNQADTLFLLLTLAILGEAAVFQVTSYTPPDNNIFYHSFAIAYILTLITQLTLVRFEKPAMLVACLAGIFIWWSSTYWKYVQRITARVFPASAASVPATLSPTGENLINKNTYMIHHDATDIPMDQWVFTGLKVFKNIYVPKPTADGIHRLLDLDLVKNSQGGLRVLNMSELTPLALEIPYKTERNGELPLWYHLGVGMFNKQAAIYEKRIAAHQYDLVLFEYIPSLNNFYPFRVRDSLRVHYKLTDSFMAPRRGETMGNIEVYVKP